MRSKLLVAGVRKRLINPAITTAARQQGLSFHHWPRIITLDETRAEGCGTRHIPVLTSKVAGFAKGAQILPSAAVSTEGLAFGCIRSWFATRPVTPSTPNFRRSMRNSCRIIALPG